MAVAVFLTSLKCFSSLNRIQVNSTSLGLAMDIELINPLLRSGGVLSSPSPNPDYDMQFCLVFAL